MLFNNLILTLISVSVLVLALISVLVLVLALISVSVLISGLVLNVFTPKSIQQNLIYNLSGMNISGSTLTSGSTLILIIKINFNPLKLILKRLYIPP